MLDVNLCSDALMLENRLVVATVNPPALYIVNDLEADQTVRNV